jgi:hypothetical protein
VKLDLRGELGKTNPVFHVSQLKPYEVSELEWPGRDNPQRPAPELVDGETEWVVERVVDKEVRMEERKVKKVVEQPVRTSGGRVLRPRPPREVMVTERVPVVWYKLRWLGYEEETWQRADACHCQELIDEYEKAAAVVSGETTAPALELAVATVVEWWTTDKLSTRRRGVPTVRCSYGSVQPLKTGQMGLSRIETKQMGLSRIQPQPSLEKT